MGQDGSKTPQPPKVQEEPEEIVEDYATKLDSEDLWAHFAHKEPKDRVFANTQSLKIVYNVSKQRLYFLNSFKYKYHYDFCSKVLGYSKPLGHFNNENYLTDERLYILGTLVYYKDHDLFGFELWPGDNLAGNRIVGIFSIIKSKAFFGNKLKFRANSVLSHRALADFPDDSVKKFASELVVTNETLFAGVKFQPLTFGTAYGVVKTLGQDDDPAKSPPAISQRLEYCSTAFQMIYHCYEVRTVASPPKRRLTISSLALITTQLQTPLCHVALLCSNRHTPNVALRSEDALKKIKGLEGKLAKVLITPHAFEISEASPDDESEWLKQRESEFKKKTDITITRSLNDYGLLSLKQVYAEKELANAVGAKAFQLARLAKLDLAEHTNPVLLNSTFVIPFCYFWHHVQKHASEIVDGFHKSIKEPVAQLDVRKKILKKLRSAVRKGAVDETIVQLIANKIQDWKQSGLFDPETGVASGVIFRSSTNVEDLPGFNGAGLYLSTPVTSPDCFENGQIATALRNVWASIWNWRGYAERAEFGINDEAVAMGLVVMPFVKPHANGVAITENPFRPDFGGIFINVQLGSKRVTDNCEGATPEQILIYDDDVPTPEIISTSSLAQGDLILSQELLVQKFFPALKRLHRHFAARRANLVGGKSKPAADVEFLILPNKTRDLCIVQARPYAVHYYG